MSERNISSNVFVSQTMSELNPKSEQAEPFQEGAQPRETGAERVSANTEDLPVISIKNFRQIFNEGEENEYRLFDDFSLDIDDFKNEGQFVSIMGGSGCGKSYLLRTVAGLNTVQEGNVLIYGKPLKEYGNLPMVFQQYSSYPWMTVLDNVAMPMRLRGVPKNEARAKASELLELVGMAEHADKFAKPVLLSGGQLQRVSIARCLACESQILLLDEATGALDIKMKREVQDILLKLFYSEKFDPTIINVTHSVEEALYLSNRIVVLEANPCHVIETIDVHYPGESNENRRGNWIFETKEYAELNRKLVSLLN